MYPVVVTDGSGRLLIYIKVDNYNGISCSPLPYSFENYPLKAFYISSFWNYLLKYAKSSCVSDSNLFQNMHFSEVEQKDSTNLTSSVEIKYR